MFHSSVQPLCLNLCSNSTSPSLFNFQPSNVKLVAVSEVVTTSVWVVRGWHQWQNVKGKVLHYYYQSGRHQLSTTVLVTDTGFPNNTRFWPGLLLISHSGPEGLFLFFLPNRGWTLITEWAYLCSQSCLQRQQELPGLLWMLMWIILQVRKRSSEVATTPSCALFVLQSRYEGKKNLQNTAGWISQCNFILAPHEEWNVLLLFVYKENYGFVASISLL